MALEYVALVLPSHLSYDFDMFPVGVQNGSVQCQCRKTCTNLWYDETVTSAPFPGPDFERTRSYTRSKEWIEKKRNLPFEYVIPI